MISNATIKDAIQCVVFERGKFSYYLDVAMHLSIIYLS